MAREPPRPRTAATPPPNYITPAGYKALTEEITQLRATRRQVVAALTIAAAEGDRSENAEYIYGKKRLREVDRRLRFLTKRIEAAVPVDPKQQRGQKVFFGATVVVEDAEGEEATYQLVGEDETVAATGRISWRSPVGQALLGRSLDDEVKVVTPAGKRVLTIIEVRYE